MKSLGAIAALLGLLGCSSEHLTSPDRGTGGHANDGTGGFGVHPTQIPTSGNTIVTAAVDSGSGGSGGSAGPDAASMTPDAAPCGPARLRLQRRRPLLRR
jgi:hypothetical protein